MKFYINQLLYEVYDHEYPPTISLNEYVRDVAGLKGTKVMCREGGCGVCTVTVKTPDFNSAQTFSINSCLCPLYIVDGWEITSIEGLGNTDGVTHPIQTRIAETNGSQCGYCTPGMVMNMYGLLHQNSQASKEFIENNFDGNLCRCTGYRPILDAMKSFAVDGNCSDGTKIDIEDLCKTALKCSKAKYCRSRCDASNITRRPVWFRPTSLNELSEIISDSDVWPYRFIFGNTSTGIYKAELPNKTYIDIRHVHELQDIKMNENCLEIGANVNITTMIDTLKSYSSCPGFYYFKQLVDHWKIIGSILIRNAGCLAGNLMIKHKHPTFPSDLFTTLESVGARIEIYDLRTSKTLVVSILEFMGISMEDKIITTLYLYSLSSYTCYRSFKIMPRSQNTRAYVNAGFRFEIEQINGKILEQPSIVFGGLGSFIHASRTEEYLQNKILSESTLRDCLNLLSEEIIVDDVSPVSSTARYRKQLSINLFYKTFIGLIQDQQRLSSYVPDDSITRGISSGEQHYQINQDVFPLKQPIIKLSALSQACGEAVYVDDYPQYKDELYGSLVLSTVGNSTIENVDFSEALDMQGVVEVITAKDIPNNGVNNYLYSLTGLDLTLEAMCTDKVWLAGQIIAVILATSQGLADDASKKVKVTYSPISSPIITDIQDAIGRDKLDSGEIPQKVKGNPTDALSKSPMITSGECKMGSQFHFYMENQITLCVPIENGLDIYCSTQYADYVQRKSASLIGKPSNYVHVTVPRLGGAFGGKTASSSHLNMVCALAAFKTNRPVRIQVKMEDSFESTGKRFPLFAKYEVGHDEKGRINVVIVDVYCDMGWKSYCAFFAMEISKKMDQGYDIENWLIRIHLVNTNKPPNVACRSPGTFPAAYIIESIVEHVASVVDTDPITVKELNLYTNGKIDLNGELLVNCTLPKLWTAIKELADVQNRQEMIFSFNKNNKWKKKGITMTPVKYGLSPSSLRFTCEITIYSSDGTVTVSQGGVEMGQGLYTKVIQAVAATLGIPINLIQIRPTNTFTSPNNLPTANSVGSELCVQAAIECSKILNKRMAPIKENKPELDWKKLVSKCNMNSIELSAKHTYYGTKDKDKEFKYSTYAVGVTEVEVDLLTGENQITRADMMVDCGDSLNPLIDIGQIEGAYVMGLGAVLLEDIVYDPESGRVLNNGTWDYNPPTCKDIPIDWRIHLLPDSPNPDGIKGSKAVGEPPLLLSTGALFAIKQAIYSFTKNKNVNVFTNTEIPFTVEKIQQTCDVQITDLLVM